MPAASLGHYASLSLIVIGRRRNWDFGLITKNADLTKEHFSIPLCQSANIPMASPGSRIGMDKGRKPNRPVA